MLGYLFAFVYTKVLARLHSRYKFPEATLAKLKRARHHGTIVSEGLEFHLFMTYLFPLSHPAAELMAHASGLGFLLRLYGHG
jgi:hypothetical protein